MIFIALNKRLIESSLYTVYVPFENSGGLNKKTHGLVIHSFLFFEQSKAFLAFYSNSGRRIEYVSMKKENLFTTISILHW